MKDTFEGLLPIKFNFKRFHEIFSTTHNDIQLTRSGPRFPKPSRQCFLRQLDLDANNSLNSKPFLSDDVLTHFAGPSLGA